MTEWKQHGDYKGWQIETREQTDHALRYFARATHKAGRLAERSGVTEQGAVDNVKQLIDNMGS
jgi:hypothetical protein